MDFSFERFTVRRYRTLDDRGRKRGCGRGNGTRRESRGIAKTKRTTRRYRGGCKSLLYFLFYTLFSLLLLFSFFFCLVAASVCTCVRVIILIRLWMLIRTHHCQIQNNANSFTLRISSSYFRYFLYFDVLLRILPNECIKHTQSLVIVVREERNASSRTPMHDRISSFRCRNHVNVINNTLTA